MKKILSGCLIGIILLVTCAPLSSTAVTSNNIDESQNDSHSGTIQITFGQNRFFDIEYYYDEKLTQPIDIKNCWLNSGESIYVSIIKAQNKNSNLYSFSEFRIIEYDAEGKRTDNITATSIESGRIYTLPDDFKGKGISILPIGTYKDREIELYSYYSDIDGNPIEFTDKMWRINGSSNSLSNGTHTTSPVESYALSFDYSSYKDSYYFVKSVPDPFYHKETDSVVVFSKVDSNEETPKFSVEMHPYISITVNDTEHHWLVDDWFDKGAIISIEKNYEPLEEYKKGSEKFKKEKIEISKTKIGDTITITVGKGYKLIASDLTVANSIPVEEGYKYTIQIPDGNAKNYQIELSSRNSNSEGKFDPSVVQNGTISLSYENGGIIKQGDELPADSQRVTLEISANDGYYVSKSNSENGTFKKTMSFSDYQKNIDTIISEHPVNKTITIELPEKDEYGKCTYKIDDKEIDGIAEDLSDNHKLKMTYTLNEESKDKYEIERNNIWDGFWSWVTGSTKVTVEIPINQELNGRKLEISDYITLKEKG